MKLTSEQIAQNVAAFDAWLNGNDIECLCIESNRVENKNAFWGNFTSRVFDTNKYLYRPKPAPKSRPWSKPEDVPGPVCWLQRVGNGWACMVTEVDDYAVAVGGGGTPALRVKFSDLEKWQYSTDRITWLPCTILD